MTFTIEKLNQSLAGEPMVLPAAPLYATLHKFQAALTFLDTITIYASNFGAVNAYASVLVVFSGVPTRLNIQEIPVGETVPILESVTFKNSVSSIEIGGDASVGGVIHVFGRVLRDEQ